MIEVGYILLRRNPPGYEREWVATQEMSSNKKIAQQWVDFGNRGREKPLYKLAAIMIEDNDV